MTDMHVINLLSAWGNKFHFKLLAYRISYGDITSNPWSNCAVSLCADITLKTIMADNMGVMSSGTLIQYSAINAWR